MKKGKIIFCLVLFMLLSCFVYYYNDYANRKVNVIAINSNTLVEEKEEILELPNEHKNKIEDLKEEYGNTDIKAVLRIPNTDKEWIIPQGDDNNFYLRHLLNKKYNINGVPFLDGRVNLETSRKLLIYGHNDSAIDMPFKEIQNYANEEYLKNHMYIELETVLGVRKFKIFSVYVETKDFSYYNKITFKTKEEYLKHLTALKDKSFYDTGVEVNSNDKILILQTCSTLKKYQNAKKKFMLVIAKEERI